jgi:hypothetical protein
LFVVTGTVMEDSVPDFLSGAIAALHALHWGVALEGEGR